MKRYNLVATISIAMLSLLSVVRMAYQTGCRADIPDGSSIEALMRHVGGVISDSELAFLKDSWANSSESVGFASIHPSPEGAAAAEREYIPNRLVHLPPYEMGLNQYGKVIFVGLAKGKGIQVQPASKGLTSLDWLEFTAHFAALIGCIVLILSGTIRTRRRPTVETTGQT